MSHPRTIAILGDSISTYEGHIPEGFAVYYTPERAALCGLRDVRDTWWSLLADALGAQVIANASYSGSMVEGVGFPAAWSPERIAALHGPAGEQPDDVVVFIGINDYGWGGARNQAMGRVAAMPPATDLSDIPAGEPTNAALTAVRDFEAAYDAMLAGVRAAFPRARIWCCTLMPGRVAGNAYPTFAWSLRGVSLHAYNDAIARAVASCGAHLVDACALGLDYEAVDGTHPTERGMRQLARMFLTGMAHAGSPEAARALEHAGSSDEGAQDVIWASRDWCPDHACVGCPWARGTGSSWYCVCEKPRGDKGGEVATSLANH